MKYEITVRPKNDNGRIFYGNFKAETVQDIVSLASHLPDHDLKIQSVGYAIETIRHPNKGCIVKDILIQTCSVAAIDCPFTFQIYVWNRDANDTTSASVVLGMRDTTEALIKWTFDHLVEWFQIDTISVTESKSGSNRYSIRIIRK